MWHNGTYGVANFPGHVYIFFFKTKTKYTAAYIKCIIDNYNYVYYTYPNIINCIIIYLIISKMSQMT